jgi:hypothetical protein
VVADQRRQGVGDGLQHEAESVGLLPAPNSERAGEVGTTCA